VSIVAVSSCGQYLASATVDGQLTVWSVNSRSCIATYVLPLLTESKVDRLQNCLEHSVFEVFFHCPDVTVGSVTRKAFTCETSVLRDSILFQRDRVFVFLAVSFVRGIFP